METRPQRQSGGTYNAAELREPRSGGRPATRAGNGVLIRCAPLPGGPGGLNPHRITTLVSTGHPGKRTERAVPQSDMGADGRVAGHERRVYVGLGGAPQPLRATTAK